MQQKLFFPKTIKKLLDLLDGYDGWESSRLCEIYLTANWLEDRVNIGYTRSELESNGLPIHELLEKHGFKNSNNFEETLAVTIVDAKDMPIPNRKGFHVVNDTTHGITFVSPE